MKFLIEYKGKLYGWFNTRDEALVNIKERNLEAVVREMHEMYYLHNCKPCADCTEQTKTMETVRSLMESVFFLQPCKFFRIIRLESARLAQEARNRGPLLRKGITTDRNDPCIKQTMPNGQQACYLVLSEEERAKGFVRPVRRSYIHVGAPGPKYPLQDITAEQKELWKDNPDPFVKFEVYPEGEKASGRYWTQKELDNVGKGCGSVTSMGQAIAETYARSPHFYSGTFCSKCGDHFKVGEMGEFVWLDNPEERVGT